ncbi:hypothetical protein TNCV_1689271 [Trichonephila clavipes]|nr:hypothetical protein TNCV_1689271 [Trichonephila clavipes]
MKPSTTSLSIWKKTNLITNQLTEVYSLATGLQKSTPLFLRQTAHDKHGGRLSGKKKLILQEPLDLLQNLRSEIRDALTDDFSDEEVPENNLLKVSLDS